MYVNHKFKQHCITARTDCFQTSSKGVQVRRTRVCTCRPTWPQLRERTFQTTQTLSNGSRHYIQPALMRRVYSVNTLSNATPSLHSYGEIV